MSEPTPPPLPGSSPEDDKPSVSLKPPRLLKGRRIVRRRKTIEPEAIRCTECGAPLEVQHAAMAQTISCGSCGAVIDLRDPERKVLRKILTGHRRPRSTLSLGAKGGLAGENWRVIGRIQLQDAEGWRWDEYLLFSPKSGYAWLEEDEGSWSLERKAKNKPEFDPKTAREGDRFAFLGETYRVKEMGAGTITYIEGEFPYHAQKDDVILTLDAEALSSNSQIAASWTQTELEWLSGKGISKSRVRRAFGLRSDGPSEHGFRTSTGPTREELTKQVVIIILAIVLSALVAYADYVSDDDDYGGSSYRSSSRSGGWGK